MITKVKFFGGRKLNVKCNGLGIYYQFNNPYFYTIDLYLLIWRCSWHIHTTKKRYDEKEQIVDFLRNERNQTSPIIELYSQYIILAQDDRDLRAKKACIDRGDIKGFFEKQRTLDLINNKKK